jgi:ribonuclease P protein component
MRDHNRLKKPADYQRVYGARSRRDGKLVAVHARPNQLPHARVGLSVSAKVGGSVVRNMVKRRLREICRAWLDGGGDSPVDVVVVARPASAEASFDDLREELNSLLREVRP